MSAGRDALVTALEAALDLAEEAAAGLADEGRRERIAERIDRAALAADGALGPGGDDTRLGRLRARAHALATRLRPAGRSLDAARVLTLARAAFAGVREAHLLPDIPPKMRRGAEKTYLHALGPQETLVGLIDLTVFHRATDGVALLDRRFIHRWIGQGPTSVDYASLRGALPHAGGSNVFVGGLELNLFTPDLAAKFCAFLGAIAAEVA
jgi:hypothetical protein